jgi:hypothetical protein
MGFITAADAVLTLSVPPLFTAPQQLKGFAADDVYNIPQIRSVETQMGVDGVLSAGFVYVPIPQEVVLQADSASNNFFDTWWTQMEATKTTYGASGIIILPGIGTKFAMLNGFLTGYTPAPAAKRVLQPRRFEVTWQTIQPARA